MARSRALLALSVLRAGDAAGNASFGGARGSLLDARLPPLLINARACSGSTAATDTARDLLRAAGATIYKGGMHDSSGFHDVSLNCSAMITLTNDGESFKEHKNCFLFRALRENKQTARRVFVAQTARAVADAGGTWLANPTFMREETAKEVTRLGGRIVAMVRANALDIVVCGVRDCFNSRQGASVDATTGQPSRVCFRRRHGGGKVKARLVVPGLEEYLRKRLEQSDDDVARLTALGFAGVRRVSHEALSAFAHGDAAASAREWHAAFASWGLADRVPEAWIAEALRASPGFNARPAPSAAAQRAAIYNYDEVRAALLASDDPRIRALIL